MYLLRSHKVRAILGLVCVGIFATSASLAMQKPYDSILVFGGSLSDPGNAFVVLSDPSSFGFDESCDPLTPLNVPPYDTLDEFYVPDGTYAIGGHHVSNGATWIEQFARNKGLAGYTRPALRNDGQKARNYAVGGARANYYPCRFNLYDQLDAFVESDVAVSADTLVVFEMGGNDIRDVLAGEIPPEALADALGNIGAAIGELYSMGARQFLLMNVPDLGKSPAVQTLDSYYPGMGIAVNASNLTDSFNQGLIGLQYQLIDGYPDMDVRIFDVHALLNSIVANPEDYGIEVTDTPCITPNVAPYKCKDPDSYLFWDGLHPTSTVHKIMSDAATEVLSSPPSP